jgi:ABC-2 type transport system permease protein
MRTAFLGAVRHEWIRLRSLRTTWLLLLAAMISNGLVALAVTSDMHDGTRSPADPENIVSVLTGASGVAPASITALLAGVLGALAGGQDYRHRTIDSTLLAVPRRGVLFTAKITAVTTWAALFAGASFGTSYAVAVGRLGRHWGSASLSDPSVHRPLLGYLALTVLTAWLGAGLAGIFRRVSAAAFVLVGLPLLVEPGIIWLLRRHTGSWVDTVADHLPFTAGQQMINLPGGDGPGNNLVVLGAVAGGITFLALVATATALSGALLVSRDS